MEYLKQSFKPLICDDMEILILGSIPGDKSIELQQYYGHPRNRFWSVIAAITKSNLPTDYTEKTEMLLRIKIGLWDVAHNAIRKGSLDSAIREEEPNQINELIKSYLYLKTVVFNGQKAERLYDKYFERIERIKYYSMPSTSPANAKFTIDVLDNVWKDIL